MGRREGKKARTARLGRILEVLHELYADATTALDHDSALELLAATILSAQCTDVRVNMVTPALFRRYPSAEAFAGADSGELEALVRTTGFFRNKARSLKAMGQALVDGHGGEVPATMEELVELPGVGRKTASVVLGTWFGVPAIPVDTHVTRLSGRLGLTEHGDPTKIERDLMAITAEQEWTFLSHGLIWHGRGVCKARKPACGQCRLRQQCPWPGKVE